MSYTVDVLTGLRQMIIDAGITPVKLGPIIDGPDDVVGLTAYPLEDDMYTGGILTGLQVRIRGAAKTGTQPVWDRQEQILLLLGRLENIPVNGHVIVVCWRQLSAPLGLDSAGRPEVFDSYYLRSDRLGIA